MVCVCVDWVEKQNVLYFPLLSRMRLCCFSPKSLCTPQSPLQTHTEVPGEPQREDGWKGLTPRFCILGGFSPWESLSWERVERGGSWEVRVKWVGEGRSLAEIMEAQVLQGTQCPNSDQCPRTSAPEATLPCRHDGYLCCKKF